MDLLSITSYGIGTHVGVKLYGVRVVAVSVPRSGGDTYGIARITVT
jgi:hypothetical protein